MWKSVLSGFFGLAIAMAGVAATPAEAAVDGCGASTGVTTSLLAGTVPSCSFLIDVVGVRFLALDVNGTGRVSGSMTFEDVAGDAQVGQITFDNATGVPTMEEGPPPACGPALFQCATSTSVVEGPTMTTVGIVIATFGADALVRVTCRGGGIAVAQSVSCSAMTPS